jgi:uncharacterized membrane protein
MSTPFLKRSLYGLIALHAVASAVTWPLLPAEMPVHFGFDGRLTSSAPASPVLWFLPAVLAWGLVALVVSASGPPESWRLSKASLASFRELTADDQLRVRDAKNRTLYVAMMLLVVSMMSVQAATFVAAHRDLDRLPPEAAGAIFASLAALVVIDIRGGRRVESLIRARSGEKLEPQASDGSQGAESRMGM